MAFRPREDVKRTILLASNGFVLPIGMLAIAGLVFFAFRTGMLKARLHIDSDGPVRQGIWTWRFTGPMRSSSSKVSGKSPRYPLALRYGTTELRYPGGDTEGGTIGVAAEANLWTTAKARGQPET